MTKQPYKPRPLQIPSWAPFPPCWTILTVWHGLSFSVHMVMSDKRNGTVSGTPPPVLWTTTCQWKQNTQSFCRSPRLGQVVAECTFGLCCLLSLVLVFCSGWSTPHCRWALFILWLSDQETNHSPITGLDLTPRAFRMDVARYATGHQILPLIFYILWVVSGDNSAVSLECPIPFRMQKWQAHGCPSWSDVSYILPDLGVWEVNIAKFFACGAVQL